MTFINVISCNLTLSSEEKQKLWPLKEINTTICILRTVSFCCYIYVSSIILLITCLNQFQGF